MNVEVLDKVLYAKANRKIIILATELENGTQFILNDENTSNKNLSNLKSKANNLIKDHKSGVIEIDNGRWFINISLPPLRLMIVGAVHIAQPLAEIAAKSDFEITIIDPRSTFATNERFPNINIVKDWPAEALKSLEIDSRTAVVTLTHDPKLDDSALQIALNSQAFYIGSLGSQKTHSARIKRLEKAGFKDNEIKNIKGPIGIKIGAKSPSEIAISIMAEIISTYRNLREPQQ